MRLLGCFVMLSVALAACELPRPEGAYFPEDAAAMQSTVIDASRVDTGVVAAPPIPGGGVSDGGTLVGQPGGDGGMVSGGPGGADSSLPLSPEQQALSKLAGRYLMRMDMLSTASVNASIITIDTRNRVSHLLATELFLQDGKLKSYERLCYQTFAHTCTRNCNSLTTTMSPRVTEWFVKMPYVERNYTLSNGTLKGQTNVMHLGFDASKETKLPTLETDMRVWDPLPGSPREGLLVTLDLAAIRSVRCNVYTVQTFVSEIPGGPLSGTADAPVLDASLKLKLVSTGSDGDTLGSDNNDCNGPEGAPPSTVDEYVRFAPVAPTEFAGSEGREFWNCPPQSAWDTRLLPPIP